MKSQARGMHLKLEGLRKSFAGKTVLQDVSLDIQPGEFVAIVGRSGFDTLRSLIDADSLRVLAVSLKFPLVGHSVFRHIK
jgi:ABC-type phosphonate transport system ATPase subunit